MTIGGRVWVILAQEKGKIYRGRGFIQLTGKDNYVRYAALAGIPDLAQKPENAAKILVTYIMHERVRILKALEKDDLINAREVVNGRNKHGLPHGYKKFAESFRVIQDLDGETSQSPASGSNEHTHHSHKHPHAHLKSKPIAPLR
jgi:hypothetical protein